MENKKEKKTERIENLQYVTLVFIIVAQCACNSNFMVGQFLYLIGNTIAVTRCFVLKRPKADKAMEIACLSITIGLITLNILK